MPPITILRLIEADASSLKAINRLIPQLGHAHARLTSDELVCLLDNSRLHLFVARNDSGDVLGMITLVHYYTPTGPKARIEDLVVDKKRRGSGIGEAMLRHALQAARENAVEFVDLTSNPARTAAHRLYRRVGFDLRDTGVFRYHIGASGTRGDEAQTDSDR